MKMKKRKKYILPFITEERYLILYEKDTFEVGHWLGTHDFQFNDWEHGAEIFNYTLEDLEKLKEYGKLWCNMSDNDFDKLCDIIAAFANIN